MLFQGKKTSKSLTVFDDEDVLFGVSDDDPSVDLFGTSSPLASSKKVNTFNLLDNILLYIDKGMVSAVFNILHYTHVNFLQWKQLRLELVHVLVVVSY